MELYTNEEEQQQSRYVTELREHFKVVEAENQKLRESEEKYRTLFENSKDVIYLREKNGILLDVNKSMEDLFGYTRQELVGMNVRDLRIAPSKVDKFQKRKETKGPVRVYEEILFEKDGTEMICRIASNAVSNDGRTSPVYVDIIHDDTKAKRLKSVLPQSEDSYRLLFEKSVDAIITVGDGKVFDCNRAALEIFGCPQKNRLLGRRISDLSPLRQPDGRFSIGKARELRLAAINKGSIISEWVFRRMDNSEFTAEVAMISIPYNGMQILFNVLRDISKNKRAEESLKRSEKQLTEIINFLPDATWAIDAEGRVTVWNSAAEAMTGIQSEDILGKGNYEYALPFYGIRRPLLVDMVLTPNNKTDHEYDFIQRTGQTLLAEGEVPFPKMIKRYLWGKARAIYNSNDEVVGAIESVRDITDQRRAEEEKRRLEDQFRQAQRMEALGTLAGGVAHDFNNLLTTIIGHSEILLSELNETHPLHQDIVEIKKAGKLAASLTRQLLTFSRKQPIQPGIHNLNQILSGIEKTLKRLIGEQIQITFDLAPDLWATLVDVGQIEQVIINLVVNAREAMLNGGSLIFTTRNIDLSTEFFQERKIEAQPGPYVLMTLKDAGIGMSAETMERIFDPFFSTKSPGKGPGLGLSAVYGIIKQSEGYIFVESELGQGTTFRIFLPMAKKSEKEKSTKGEKLVDAGGSETVLLIEDDETVRPLISDVLERQNYCVLTADCGETAVNLSKNYDREIHLILSDLVMPGMSGKESADIISQDRPQIKVLFMSGYLDDSVSKYGILNPGIHFIAKPFSIDELARRVREILDGHSTSAAPPAL